MDYYRHHVETALKSALGAQPRLVIPVEALKWLTKHDDLIPDWLFQLLTDLFAEKPKKPKRRKAKRGR